jgi:hypothetical protein
MSSFDNPFQFDREDDHDREDPRHDPLEDPRHDNLEGPRHDNVEYRIIHYSPISFLYS